jgi:hypothetical protein
VSIARWIPAVPFWRLLAGPVVLPKPSEFYISVDPGTDTPTIFYWEIEFKSKPHVVMRME